MNEGDNPPIGIVLCADKNDSIVQHTLPEDNTQIFASKYMTYLPSEEELKKELRLDEFLNKHKLYNSFTDNCIEAEKSLVVSYSTTAILTRRALELAVKWVFSYKVRVQKLERTFIDNDYYKRDYINIISNLLFEHVDYDDTLMVYRWRKT